MGKKSKIAKWIIPNTKGAGPCPRYQHCMKHLPRQNLIIIHGGRTSQNVKVKENKFQSFMTKPNSDISKTDSKDAPKSFTLGDLWALKLDSLEWIKIQLPNEEKLARANHCMSNFGDESLLIFGGNGSNSMYCNKEYVVTLASQISSRRGSIQSNAYYH